MSYKFMEGFTFKEQLRLFYYSDIVVSPHSASFINLIFSVPHTVVVECYPPYFFENWYSNTATISRVHYIMVGYFDRNPKAKMYWKEAEDAYKQLLRSNGVEIQGSEEESTVTEGSATGTISLISPVVIDGNTHYYVMIAGNDTLYDCPVANIVDIVRYKEGDDITLNFSSGGGSLVVVDSISQPTNQNQDSNAAAGDSATVDNAATGAENGVAA